jgi:hypothetical protein
MSVIKSYNLFLSSQNRIETVSSTSAFSFYLRNTITKRDNKSQFRVKVIQATIPFSFSEINSNNQNIVYTYNNLGYQITIPIGTYTILSLLDFIKTSLEIAHTITLIFDFNSNTNLCTFEISPLTTGNHNIVFSHLLAGNVPILRQLGITNQNLVMTMVGGISTVGTQSNQSVNINPSRNIYIRSDSLQGEAGNQENVVGDVTTTDILAIIPITVPFSNYISFFDTSSFYTYLNNNSIDYISLYLTDATSDESLLGLFLNWSVTLVIEEYLTPQSIDVSPILNTAIPRGDPVKPRGDPANSQPPLPVLIKEKDSLTNSLKKERERLVKSLQVKENKEEENKEGLKGNLGSP